MYDEQMDNQEDVLRSLMELIPKGPLLPNIQGLRWGIRPQLIRDFERLLIHSICAIQLSCTPSRSVSGFSLRAPGTFLPLLQILSV
jgi:hypothetical protein